MCFSILGHRDVDNEKGCVYVGVEVCGKSLNLLLGFVVNLKLL